MTNPAPNTSNLSGEIAAEIMRAFVRDHATPVTGLDPFLIGIIFLILAMIAFLLEYSLQSTRRAAPMSRGSASIWLLCFASFSTAIFWHLYPLLSSGLVKCNRRLPCHPQFFFDSQGHFHTPFEHLIVLKFDPLAFWLNVLPGFALASLGLIAVFSCLRSLLARHRRA